jgi:hypothetical protein
MSNRRDMLAWLGASTLLGRRAFAAGGAVPLAVIVSARSGVMEMSGVVLRSIFLGDAVRGPGDVRYVAFNQPPQSTDRTAFDRLALGLSPGDVGKYWLDRRIRGEGRPPKMVESLPLLQKLVAVFPGAISYVRADQLVPTLRALRIDGKLPTDPGYLLKE